MKRNKDVKSVLGPGPEVEETFRRRKATARISHGPRHVSQWVAPAQMAQRTQVDDSLQPKGGGPRAPRRKSHPPWVPPLAARLQNASWKSTAKWMAEARCSQSNPRISTLEQNPLDSHAPPASCLKLLCCMPIAASIVVETHQGYEHLASAGSAS